MVVSHARAEDIDERESFVLQPLLDELGQVFLFAAESASNKCCTRGQSHRDGIDRRLDAAVRCALGLHADGTGGRDLARGQAVDLVVHGEVEQVDIAAHRVDEMIAANSEAVAITAGHDHGKIVIREFHSRGHSERAPVQRVHAVGTDVPWQVRGAADAADGHHVKRVDLQIDQRFLERREHAEISAAGAPVGIDLAFIIRQSDWS